MTERPTPDEADLATRCAEGDAAAWRALVDGYGGMLSALARRMLHRRLGRAADADVDEVVAEVFLALLRRDGELLRRYDPRWRLGTWLGVICRSQVTRLLRRGRRLPASLPEPAQVGDDAAVEPAGRLAARERAEAAAALAEALEGLDERDRLLLSMRYLDGLSYRAIAAAVGVAPGSVGPLLQRARRRLAERAGHLARFVDEG